MNMRGLRTKVDGKQSVAEGLVLRWRVADDCRGCLHLHEMDLVSLEVRRGTLLADEAGVKARRAAIERLLAEVEDHVLLVFPVTIRR